MSEWEPTARTVGRSLRSDLRRLLTLAHPRRTLYRNVHIKAGRRTGIHCPWMILDDVALILGRELLGYPKKLGEIGWRLDSDTIRAEAGRRGSTLITMGGTLGKRLEDAPPILGRPHRNVMGLAGLTLPRVVASTPRERPVEVREVTDVELRIGGSEHDPLDQMGPRSRASRTAAPSRPVRRVAARPDAAPDAVVHRDPPATEGALT